MENSLTNYGNVSEIDLGNSDIQREQIIQHFQSIDRDKFEDFINKAMTKSKQNSFELVTLSAVDTNEGLIVSLLIF